MRFHKIANVNKALDFIASKGVKLVSIGAEGNWRIFKFKVADFQLRRKRNIKCAIVNVMIVRY